MNLLLLLSFWLGQVLSGTGLSAHLVIAQEVQKKEVFYFSPQSKHTDSSQHADSMPSLLIEETNETEVDEKVSFEHLNSSLDSPITVLFTSVHFLVFPLFSDTSLSIGNCARLSRCILFRNLRI